MKGWSLFRVEVARLFRDRLTWLALAVSVLSPAAGLWLYRPLFSSSAATSYATSLTGAYLGNPALAGAIGSAVAFALLTAWECSRGHRSHVDILTDAMISPLQAGFCRIGALLLAAVAAQALTLTVWLPFTAAQIGSVFRGWLYVAGYLTFMLPAALCAVLFTASAYQITRRLDLTLVLFAAFALLSLTAWEENWLLRWLNPAVNSMSDDFGNVRLLRSVLYNRLFWLLLLCGLCALSFLCVRRYGKGIFGSAARNLRKVYLPLLVVASLLSGYAVYTYQPFLDHSKAEIDMDSYYNITYNESVFSNAIHVDARPNLSTGCFYGTAVYSLHNISGEPQTISFQTNPGYQVQSATVNEVPVTFRDLEDDDQNTKTIEVDLPAVETMELVIEYGGFPQEWNLLELSQGALEISRDYIYLANQDFSPMPKDFVWETEEQPPFTAEIDLPAGMTPVLFAEGTVEQMGKNPDGSYHWKLIDRGQNIILYAGDYISHHIDAAGIDVEFFYSAKHKQVMEECNVDSVVKQVFDYCTEHYGPLSFYGDSSMKLIEIGMVGGGYAANGASAMGEDSFNEQGLKDPLKGAGGSEVLAHEIVHQWWGLGNMFDSQDASDPWSAEGLTVYTTYRMMKEQYGDAYAKKNYVDVWQEQVDDYYQNFYVRHPEYLEQLPEQYRADIANSLSQVRQYCEMPLKILKAEQLVGGEEAMDAILAKLFTRQLDPTYPYLTYQDFLSACALTEEDLNLA
ncbi:MAG: hypothetical protein ACLVAH_09975 [Anaeromassilibacillus sp.]